MIAALILVFSIRTFDDPLGIDEEVLVVFAKAVAEGGHPYEKWVDSRLPMTWLLAYPSSLEEDPERALGILRATVAAIQVLAVWTFYMAFKREAGFLPAALGAAVMAKGMNLVELHHLAMGHWGHSSRSSRWRRGDEATRRRRHSPRFWLALNPGSDLGLIIDDGTFRDAIERHGREEWFNRHWRRVYFRSSRETPDLGR